MENNMTQGGGAAMPPKKPVIHWNCCLMPLLGKLFWIAGIAALVAAWISGNNGSVWGFGADQWYMNALVMGVLAITGSRKRMGSCRAGGTCGPHGAGCSC